MPTMILFAALALIGVGMAGMGIIRSRRSYINIDERLAGFGERTLSLEERELKIPFSERVLKPAIKRWSVAIGSRSGSGSIEKMRAKLAQAGNPSGLGPGEFIGLRFLLAGGLAAAGFFLIEVVSHKTSTAMLLGAVFGGFGFIIPGIWISRKIKARKKEITRSMPDAIDLLAISVESGLGFDPALMRVAEKWDNALTREFARVLSEMRIGKSKREALREMALRVDEDGLTTFVSAVIQADQLGVAITQVLRIQSDAMRVRRRQRAQEAAQKAPLKMLFPMVFLIFPALYVVILGPAVPRMISAFK